MPLQPLQLLRKARMAQPISENLTGTFDVSDPDTPFAAGRSQFHWVIVQQTTATVLLV